MYVESPFNLQPAQAQLGCNPSIPAKPFLKWVGGKTQLIDQLDACAPLELKAGEIDSYFEPFVGGGAFFFHAAQKYALRRLVIADSNQDLILAYWTIRDNIESLVSALMEIQSNYLALSEENREAYYYKTRTCFNQDKIDLDKFSDAWIERTAQLIFLNKTCFNGLFRVNASGLFNVAFGRYANPKICDPENLQAVSAILQDAEILLGDFSCVLEKLDSRSFLYLDPPYRPLTSTANFTGYSSSTFTDRDQERLASFCRQAEQRGAKLMISNSDPDNVSSTDTFFQDTYPGYTIKRALASRMVNCKADKRGKISELIIMNYSPPAEQDDSPSDSSSSAPEVIAMKIPPIRTAVAKNATVSGATAKVPESANDAVVESASSAPANTTGTMQNRRSAAALGAFDLLHECARSDRGFSLAEMQEATGWKAQTAKTYLSKKWKDYLDPDTEAGSRLYKVRKSFLALTKEGFLAEFSQVLANVKPARPTNIQEAKLQAKQALEVYAEFLGQAHQGVFEEQVRKLIERLELIP